MEEREFFSAPKTEWVSMFISWEKTSFSRNPSLHSSPVWCREVAAVVPTQKICLGAVSLAYLYLFTWMQPSCIFAEMDAVGQVEMPCEWPAGPPQSHTCLPCCTVPLLTWIIRKKLDFSPVHLLQDKALLVCACTHLSAPTFLQNITLKVWMALEVILLLVVYSAFSLSSSFSLLC